MKLGRPARALYFAVADRAALGLTAIASSLLAIGLIGPPSAGQGSPSRTIELNSTELERAGIVTTAVRANDSQRIVRVVGQVVRSPDATHAVRSPVEGRVESLLVTPGTVVRRGQLLMTLHSHRVHEVSANLRLAKSELEIARNRLEAGRQLLELEGISRLELERREQEALRADLAVQALVVDMEDVGLTREEIDAMSVGSLHGELPVRARVAGTVLDLHVATEARVLPWEPLLSIGKSESLELDLQVQPSLSQGIRPGDQMRFAPVGSEACCDAVVLTRIPQVDPTTRTVKVRAQVTGSTTGLVAGMFVEGKLTSSGPGRAGQSSATLVPAGAILRLDGEDVAFVLERPGRFRPTPVEAGAFDGTHYQINNGLSVGQQVVVEGTFLLKSKLLRDASAEGDAGRGDPP